MENNGGKIIIRVISGIAKGHKLKTLKGDATRPTSDRVKEALFSIIMNYIQDAEVLDLFAGTGNLGIEALSRGAKSAVFIDKSEQSINLIKENLLHTKLLEKGLAIKGEVSEVLKRFSLEQRKYDLIFLDPPYSKNLAKETLILIEKYNLLRDDGLIIVEKDKDDKIPSNIGKYNLASEHKYGDSVLCRYIVKI